MPVAYVFIPIHQFTDHFSRKMSNAGDKKIEKMSCDRQSSSTTYSDAHQAAPQIDGSNKVTTSASVTTTSGLFNIGSIDSNDGSGSVD